MIDTSNCTFEGVVKPVESVGSSEQFAFAAPSVITNVHIEMCGYMRSVARRASFRVLLHAHAFFFLFFFRSQIALQKLLKSLCTILSLYIY